MGHRALVAYQRPDRLYDLRYSHWGGEELSFAAEITASTPLAEGAIDSDVLTNSITCDRILTDYLDPRIHEALYLVTPTADYATDAFRVCWLEWGLGRDSGRGVIVETEPAEDRALRVWFRATKTALADAIEMGVLSRRAARAYLEARICEEKDGVVYTYGDSTEPQSRAGTASPLATDMCVEDDSERQEESEEESEEGK
ncbi:DUF6735 family protein [Natrinema halophilum]|uniref:Uncharacterized protein n=1 Tax=Natrinema halophilum TaxID=1699371 RepID=A0A7D5KJN2_9EURY|nr:DUF6735 family protein [Natrinema halophilum]QLG48278.1 hypothetical protein HYG82_05155 [Natrinema halophilum]